MLFFVSFFVSVFIVIFVLVVQCCAAVLSFFGGGNKLEYIARYSL